MVLVLASCALVNVRGEVHGWSLNHRWWEHGWPITWLGRDYDAIIRGQTAIIEVRQEDKYGRADPMWPWNLAPGQGYGFSSFYLAVRKAAAQPPCRWFRLLDLDVIKRNSGLAGIGEYGVGQPHRWARKGIVKCRNARGCT